MKPVYKVFILVFFMALTSSTATIAQTGSATQGKMLRHVVMFKFKDSAAATDVEKVEKAFAGLSKSIPLIKAFEWGLNNSPENLNQGLTHCFLASFSSEKDRDAYLVHPKHKEFVTLLGPYLEKATVLDYWTK